MMPVSRSMPRTPDVKKSPPTCTRSGVAASGALRPGSRVVVRLFGLPGAPLSLSAGPGPLRNFGRSDASASRASPAGFTIASAPASASRSSRSSSPVPLTPMPPMTSLARCSVSPPCSVVTPSFDQSATVRPSCDICCR